jgi:hypothetical protein
VTGDLRLAVRARDNPFATDRVLAVRYRLAGTTWEELLARLARLRHRAALVGPEGAGKTTLLEDLAPRLAERGFRIHLVQLREGERRLPAGDRALPRRFGPRDLVLLDGADALTRPAWLGLRLRTRPAGGLVVTSHRPGLLPTLHRCTTSPELLAGIVRDLLGAGESAGTCPPELPAELFTRHGGNLRDALRELYDRWAAR